MPIVKVYGCLVCGRQYRAEKLNFGISPKEIRCEYCEGTATLNYTDVLNENSFYKLVQPDEKQLAIYKRTEAIWYKRYGFSDWECEALFMYEIESIKQGFLILIRK